MAERGHGASFHQPDAGDNAVGGQFFILHAESGALVLGEHAEFLERIGLEECLDALACGEESFVVALLDFGGGAADERVGAAFVEVVQEFFVDGHAGTMAVPRVVRRIR